MPTRLIREGILTSDAVNSLSAKDEVLYRRLMSVVDDYGLYDGRVAILRAQLYPLQLDQIRESDVVRGLAACEKASLIRCYEVDGKPYVQLLNFGQQTRSNPKWPKPPDDAGECEQMKTTDNSCKQLKTVAHLVGVGVGDGCGVGQTGGTTDTTDDERGKAIKSVERLIGKGLAAGPLSSLDRWALTLDEIHKLGGKTFTRWGLILAASEASIAAAPDIDNVRRATAYMASVIQNAESRDKPPGEFDMPAKKNPNNPAPFAPDRTPSVIRSDA